uniref:LysM domain-containing protein n=1 Tax=Leersia perrieri TaxID=77586 RepID=A0A0D9VNH8_9ORYZ
MGVPSSAHHAAGDLGGGDGSVVTTVEVEQSPPPMSSCGRYILHRVCRFDTLAGVAIKYGLEVADVKRVNGLTTDLQMFAHKTLRIPLPGRHPPATHHPPREWTTRRPPKNAALDPLLKPPRSTASPSMNLLQSYYGLARPPKGSTENEGTEMATYSIGQPRKAISLSTGFSLVSDDATREVEDAEKPIRRRQKSDAEFSVREGNTGGLMKAGPGLALRPKSGNRPDINNSQQDLVATAVPSYGDGLQAVRKSSSSPEFQESDNSIASVWLKSKWGLKPDAFTLPLPILLLDSIPKPIFDSFPKQIAAWRNKAARD